MWHVVAEEDMGCTECGHDIRAGSECLSQMPLEMPDGFHRRKYDNFCVACTECNAKGKLPCYVRALNHWYTKRQAPDLVDCGYCENPVTKGKWVVSQKLYAWPDIQQGNEDSQGPAGRSNAGTGVRASGSSAAWAAKQAHSGAWRTLSPSTKRIFRTRGLGRGISPRSVGQAQRFYEASVPQAIRNRGEGAVLRFVGGKHASHIRSVAKAPSWAKRTGNVVWENPTANLSRGSRSMTAREAATIRTANRVSAIGATVRGAAKGGAIAAAMEAPIAVVENLLHWKRGRKSRGKAAADAAKDVGGAAAVGTGVTLMAAGAAKGATLAGSSLTLGPAGLPLAAAGAALMIGTTVHRLYKAAKRDIPLDGYYLYFCDSTDCRTQFAQHVTDAALGHGQRRHIVAIALAIAGLTVSAVAIGVWLV